MAPYKPVDLSSRFLAVDLEKQLLPGSFAHAVHHLLDHDFDLSVFDARYRNDANGATAYPPGMLFKIILCAYADGVVSSRGIERLCRDHVIFIALCGDSDPTSPPWPPSSPVWATTLPATGRTTLCRLHQFWPSKAFSHRLSDLLAICRAAKNPGCTEMTQPVLPKGPIRCLPVSRYQYCEQQINGGLLELPDHGVPRCNRIH